MVKKVMGEEKGSVMIMVVLALVVLIGFTGLVIDGGSLYLTKSRLQNAADAAALAGAQSLPTPAHVAITYAGHNGMKPLVGDASPSDSGNTYIASRSGDIVKVDYIESTEFTTLEPMYTEEEIDQKVAVRNSELNDMSDTDLMAEADLYSISYETTGEFITHGQLGSKSNSELLALAKANWVTGGLLTKDIDGMTIGELGQCALENGYTIPNKYLPLKDKDKDAVAGLLKIYLQSDQGTIVADRPALINALYTKLNEGETISLKNPDAVRTALLAKYRDELQKQKKIVNQGHPDRVRVTCTRTVQNSFMSVLGFRNSTVSATAVAEWRTWDGEALPFVNMGDKYSEDPLIDVWGSENVAPGNKERIHDDVVDYPPNNVIRLTVLNDETVGPYMYMKGGVAVGSDIEEPLTNIVVSGNNVYVLSLRDDLLDDENSYANAIKNINKYHLPMSDLVLLKCIVNEDWGGVSEKTCYLTFVEAYDWHEEKNTFVMGDPPKLVE